jgi:type I restriction enzyme M protein
LFERNVGKAIRAELIDKCNLHTILRLPTGIFYAQGVKTSVLFFTRGETDKGNTHEVWVYDQRSNLSAFGRRNILTRQFFEDFEAAFGDDPLGSPKNLAKRVDTGETGRFRRFTREWISAQGDTLDLVWLKEENETIADDLPESDVLLQEAIDELEAALAVLRDILAELGGM